MLERRYEELARAAEVQDAASVQAGIWKLWDAAKDADAAELSRLLEQICGLFEALPLGLAGRLAVLAGALVEGGADPAPLVAPVAGGLAASLDGAAEFAAAWRRTAGVRRDLPEPVDEQAAFEAAVTALVGRGGWRGRLRRSARPSDHEAYLLAEGWFTAAQWVLPAASLLQIGTIRAEFPMRERLSRAVTALAPIRADLECLAGLLAVLDGERLVVLHRPTRRGFEVAIGGIGDNFQLHTLLAATLSGAADDGRLEGVRPDSSWVAAASDGPVEPPSMIRGQFNLVDGYGEWIWNEGRPADIPLLAGRRVVVLDPPAYERTWNIGRTFPAMRPTINLERIMPGDEAAGWWSRVAPAAGPAATPRGIRFQR